MLFEEIIQSHYRPSEYPALASLAEEWQDSRPFEGLKILVATPIFRNTLLQYEALLAGGAELYVGRAVENAAIPCDFEIVELLQESEIPVVSPEMVLDMEQEDEFFDLILDCAGQSASRHPKIAYPTTTIQSFRYLMRTEASSSGSKLRLAQETAFFVRSFRRDGQNSKGKNYWFSAAEKWAAESPCKELKTAVKFAR